jgi:glycosyltransferase involved in cell wall biosynthesis
MKEGIVEWPSVSIVLPCRNEVRHIGPCLDSILASEYPQDRLQVVIADGMSDDGTRELIAKYTAAHPRIIVLDNPRRIAPSGMNVAVRAATGEIVVRMDAHAMYPKDYLLRLVGALLETGADNVGTLVETLPADHTPMARAIAIGLSHRLGVGNSAFRVGTRTRKWVDHVCFGCWRREVLERLGEFDEDLVRGQDVEYNARLLNQGGRILLLPDVSSAYHARRSLSQLARMMYQYGYFKPLIARKAGRVLTVRQLVPSLFVLALLVTAALSLAWPLAFGALLAIIGAYLSVIAGGALLKARREGGRTALALVAVFPAMHFTYGVGYLQGLVDHFMPFRRARRPSAAVALTR